ncbi:protein draper-like, partial [Saccostrea cucullata]|uniref:protein draper-like n=1 Tax=Saccostrea cuccullata TaxID=36930 RepID=UPI002ED1C32F
CETGYQGKCCSRPCRFPSYGDCCQSECNCEERFCIHAQNAQKYMSWRYTFLYLVVVLKECGSGYNGTNCSSFCIYPFYGDQCLQKCNCTKESCDNALGCIDEKPMSLKGASPPEPPSLKV